MKIESELLKENNERENHFYICVKCGFFYKIVNGIQVRQKMYAMGKVNDYNFHESINHKCIKQYRHGIKEKGLKENQKSGLYSEKPTKSLHKSNKDSKIYGNDRKKSSHPFKIKSNYI